MIYSSHSALVRNASTYQLLAKSIGILNPKSDAVAICESVRYIAAFAANNHSGRFSDGALENPLIEIGHNLKQHFHSDSKCTDYPCARSRHSGRRHVLHVATTVFPTGGHTRTIENWIVADRDSTHSLFLTNQANTPIRSELSSILHLQKGGLVCAKQYADGLTKAIQLRRYAQQWADMVILHHGSDDIVPVLAFATNDSPPIAILNHADHIFWLGSGVADTTLNLRGISVKLSQERRESRSNTTIPIPLASTEVLPSKEVARAELGIDRNCVVYLSVGRPSKYISTFHEDFFRTASTILDRCEESMLMVVGPKPDEVHKRLPIRFKDRIRLLGPVTSTATYRAAADIYLESFPFGSHTAALEAGRAGLPLVLAYSTPTPFLATTSEWLDPVLTRPTTESMYIDLANYLALNRREREQLGQAVKDRINEWHCGDGWKSHLDRVYRQLDSTAHNHTAISVSEMKSDDVDIATAQWHLETNRETVSPDPESYAVAWMRDSAFRWRNQRQYLASAKLLWHATYVSKGAPAVMYQLIKLAPHWAATKFGLIG